MTSALDRAAEVIRAALADGPRTAGAIETAGRVAGISIRTLRRAADRIGVVRDHQGARSVWTLPSTDTEPGTVPGREENDMTESPAPLALLAITDGLTVGGRVLARGDRIEMDADAVEATRDRFGESWTDDLSPRAQMERWGVVHLAVDDTPAETVTGSDRRADDTVNVADRRTAIRPDPVETVAGPRNLRLTPPGQVPFLTGLGGDGPITVVPDDAAR